MATTPQIPPSIGRGANIFMIVAMSLSTFYLIGFMFMYPKYWYAALLFVIIAVVGVVKRIAILRGVLPPNHIPSDDNSSTRSHE